MRIATIEILIQTIAELYPVTFSPNQIPAFTEQYRAVLSGISGDELNAAWHKCMETWRKKAGPSAADILDAHRSVSKRAAKDGQPGTFRSTQALKDCLDERAEKHRKDRRELIDEYERDHPRVISTAQAEGWLPSLLAQIQIGANMLAQRNQIREDKKGVRDLSEEDQAYFGIYVFEGAERLTITQAMIDLWRGYLSSPAPTPPSRSSTFKQAAA